MKEIQETTQPHYSNWFSTHTLPNEMALILKTPVMERAISVLVEMGLNVKCPLDASLESHALRNAYRDGYFAFLTNLKLLTIPPKNKNEDMQSPLPPPFEGIDDEESVRDLNTFR
jgi:hypothetical protein